MASRLMSAVLMLGVAVAFCVAAEEHPTSDAAGTAHSDTHEVTAEADPAHEGADHDGGEHAAHGDAGHDEGDHGHASHDPFGDALHGNAGPNQGKPEEWRMSLSIWSWVVFGLLTTILWKFAWGPIRDALDHREQSVQANIDAAAEQNAKAAALLAEHEAKLTGAADEVRQMIDQARKEAEVQKANIIAEAQAAATAEKNRAIQEIQAAKNGAIQELAERSVEAAVGMAGSIVKRELQSKDHSSLISEALKHFPSKN